MAEMEKALHARDFGTFAKITMQDSNQFHAVRTENKMVLECAYRLM